MTSPQGNPARREPLLWLQLLGLGALPLEVAALLLVLAGADPGPLPGLERVLCWALGSLGPAALFWKLPPDLWSLLLLQVPLRGRRPDQLRLSALQSALPLKLLGAAGAPLLLPVLWWADRTAGLAWSISPFTTAPRALVLLLAAALLALMLWQWNQILQALWMFSRTGPQVSQTLPLSSADAAERRLNIGLPLLLLAPLANPEPSATVAEQPSRRNEPEPEQGPEPTTQPVPAPEKAVEPAAASDAPIETTEAGIQAPVITPALEERATPKQSAPDASEEPASGNGSELAPSPRTDSAEKPVQNSEGDQDSASATASVIADVSTTVEPEEAAEQAKRADLDQQV